MWWQKVSQNRLVVKKLLRIENLMLLVPLTASFAIAYELWVAWFGQSKYDYFSFPGARYSLLNLSAILVMPALGGLLFILPLYMMHYFLRLISRRNRPVCFIHSIATTVYWVLLSGPFAARSVVPGWHTTVYYSPFFLDLGSGTGFWASALFWVLQFGFIIYGFTLIRRWRKSAR